MSLAGLVGGLGPESTVDYYRRILDQWRREHPGTAPPLLIDSLDPDVALRLVAADESAFADYLLASVKRLAAGGASFAAICANTPHLVFDRLEAESPIPLVSIVQVCARAAMRVGCRRPLLLGTRFTMEAPFYPQVFSLRGMTIVAPNHAERGWLHERYVGELLHGVFSDETRDELRAIVRRRRDEDEVDAVILGGTELPLLVGGSELEGLPLLDTTALHVSEIVGRLGGEV